MYINNCILINDIDSWRGLKMIKRYFQKLRDIEDVWILKRRTNVGVAEWVTPV